MPNGERRSRIHGCTCDETEGSLHACPYAVEIEDADPNEDDCDCCAACENECALAV